MRLLNTQTLELRLFIDAVPEYAILSHRWEAEEVIFEDMLANTAHLPTSQVRHKQGFSKVARFCALAAKDGFDWVWVDSCCIDKSSSAELQEAINSMFRWYQDAQICYAYLADVCGETGDAQETAFRQSLWFTRGWTLQELIAPHSVEFYAKDWSPIGSKSSRYKVVSELTGIKQIALCRPWTEVQDDFVAAEKMSWASHRQVSRAEDATYCLLGLFDINMPMLYGEGSVKAFHRLQQAIYARDADSTLFLFTSTAGDSLFASSQHRFCQRPGCVKQGCYYSNINYSRLIPMKNQGDFTEDDHFLRIDRRGVMVKLPLIAPVPEGLSEVMCQGIAILPYRYCSGKDHSEAQGLGIGLTMRQGSHFVRVPIRPMLWPLSLLKRLPSIPRTTITVSHYSSLGMDKYVVVLIRSSSFQLLEWEPEPPGNQWIYAADVSSRAELRFHTNLYTGALLTFSTVGSSSHNMTLQIYIGKDPATEACKSRSWKIDRAAVYSKESNSRLVLMDEGKMSQKCDRLLLQIGAGLRLSIALRQLGIPTMDSGGRPSDTGISRRYRIDLDVLET
ncbi:hypothetical protein ACN47E_010143 [Coniothyrium glycines]